LQALTSLPRLLIYGALWMSVRRWQLCAAFLAAQLVVIALHTALQYAWATSQLVCMLVLWAVPVLPTLIHTVLQQAACCLMPPAVSWLLALAKAAPLLWSAVVYTSDASSWPTWLSMGLEAVLVLYLVLHLHRGSLV
jgi:hypothetical protein